MRSAYLCSVILVGLTGCATSGINYDPPETTEISNELTVNGEFDQVWDRLVEQLASDFFVINNIEKSSKLINVSFSSSQPERFVTCGTTSREFTNAQGTEKYQYDAAASARYSITDNRGIAYNVVRETSLDGRANVYVAPEGGESTMVRVNAKYVVDMTKRFTRFSGESAGTRDHTFDFSTNHEFSGSQGVKCVSKGILEQRILDYAR